MVLLKITLLFSFLLVFYQDIKERQVYWFLFPIIAICCGILHYKQTVADLFLFNVVINLSFISILFLVIYIYSKYKLKIQFNATFGLGDVLLFLALSFSFSSVSFIMLFVFSLIFSLVLHLILNRNTKLKTVPLAGYMSLFFAIAYLGYWFGAIQSLYII